MASCKLIFAFIFLITLVINAVPSSAISPAPLTSIRVESEVLDVGAHNGLIQFGEPVPGEQIIGHPIDVCVPPTPRRLSNGITSKVVTITSKFGKRITRVELKSWLGAHSTGERVHEMGFSPNHHQVKLWFCSKPYAGINYTITLFGL